MCTGFYFAEIWKNGDCVDSGMDVMSFLKQWLDCTDCDQPDGYGRDEEE